MEVAVTPLRSSLWVSLTDSVRGSLERSLWDSRPLWGSLRRPLWITLADSLGDSLQQRLL